MTCFYICHDIYLYVYIFIYYISDVHHKTYVHIGFTCKFSQILGLILCIYFDSCLVQQIPDSTPLFAIFGAAQFHGGRGVEEGPS